MARTAGMDRFPETAKYKAYSIVVPPSLFERFRTGAVTGRDRQGEQAVPIKALAAVVPSVSRSLCLSRTRPR